MRIVVALGGNALLRRGQPLTAKNQRANARVACTSLAEVADGNELVVSHGNGPQVGLLALQASVYTEVEPYPLDMLGAQTEGMIGYVIQQELGNQLPQDRRIASLLTLVEVDPADPAFRHPSKPIGPVYDKEEGERLARSMGWTVRPDSKGVRRVVASPEPRHIYGLDSIQWLLEKDCVVVCAGGGGIPVTHTSDPVPAGRRSVGVEAVIDKDAASAVLAAELEADALIILTDVDAVYADFGTRRERAIRRATPEALSALNFSAGSMAPKVRAAADYVARTGGIAAIGSITDTAALLEGRAGTLVTSSAAGLEYAQAA